jgi:hypothetical protein
MDTHDVPSEVRAQVREEANHACAQCGAPVVEYYTIRGGAGAATAADDERTDGLIALCPACRVDAAAGRVDAGELRASKTDPAVASPEEHPFHFGESVPRLVLGNVAITLPGETVEPTPVIRLDARQLLGVSVADGRLGLDVDFFDDARPIASLADGEWSADEPDAWTVSYAADDRTLKLRNADENVGIGVRAFCDPAVVLVTGTLSYHGKAVHIRRASGVTVPASNSQFSDYDFRLSEDGAAVLSLG